MDVCVCVCVCVCACVCVCVCVFCGSNLESVLSCICFAMGYCVLCLYCVSARAISNGTGVFSRNLLSFIFTICAEAPRLSLDNVACRFVFSSVLHFLF